MTILDKGYQSWLKEIKERIHTSQIKAALKVNAELLGLYWHLGREILEKEKNSGWGKKLIEELSRDLLSEFPNVKGFSRDNLYRIRQWVLFYTQKNSIVAQLAPQLTGFGQEIDNKEDNASKILGLLCQVPWGHHREIIAKCGDVNEALFYINETIKHNWSRNVLLYQIASGLWNRQGKAITNFQQSLPAYQRDLASGLIKDPYSFDFLNLSPEHKERELESALTDNLVKFLLELGTGFAFVGNQYQISVGNKEFFIDLLFYHLTLRCFVVIELKAGDFMPEYAGKLNFYINVVDDTMRKENDNPTIGFLICANRNQVVTEYALRGINTPIGVSEYQLTKNLPGDLKGRLPTNKQIAAKLSGLENETIAE